jgi:endonuclease-3
MSPKVQFEIDVAMSRIAEAVRPYPKAALFELAEEGFATSFEQAVACIISARTLEEVTLPTARRLFAAAPSPAAVASLSISELDKLIHDSAFHSAKARQIHEIARRVVDDYGGALPCDEATLLSLPGIGPKCAHLVLGIACGQPRVAVDVHVHRVTNRWGYVHTRTPEETSVVLEEKLPRRYWIEINRLLVPFGKYICTGRLPKCSTCVVLQMCRQIGVVEHR